MKEALVGVAIIGLLILMAVGIRTCATTGQVADRVLDGDNIVNQDNEFNRLYETIQKTCQDIAVLESSTEESSGGFSKADRVYALRAKLGTMVADYNKRSQSLESKYWKLNPNLPKSISITDPCSN